MKHIYTLTIILLINFMYAQQKAFTPKSGEIVFVKQESADNKDAYLLAGQLAKEQVMAEMAQQGETLDTVTANKILKKSLRLLTMH